MIGIFLSLILFAVTVPIKAVLFATEKSIKMLELKVKSLGSVSDKTKQKEYKVKQLSLKAMRISVKALKSLVNIIRGAATVIASITGIIGIFVIFIVIVLVTASGSIVTLFNDSTNSGGSSISGGNNTVIEQPIAGNKEGVEGLMSSAKEIYAHWSTLKFPSNIVCACCGRSISAGSDMDYCQTATYEGDHLFRPDCSGYMSEVLKKMGYMDEDYYPFGSSNMTDFMDSCDKFQRVDYTGIDSLKAGDITRAPGHTCMYAGDGKWYTIGDHNYFKDHPEMPIGDGYNNYWVGILDSSGSETIVWRLK